MTMGFPAIAAVSLALFSHLGSQAPSSESICGSVQDQTGASIVGAALDLSASNTRLSTSGTLSAKTDARGQFCFNSLEPGEYELTVQARGFRTDRRRVTGHAGESIRLAIALRLESVAEQVTVAEGSADIGSLNVTQTQIGAGLIQNLPSES